MSNIIEHIGKLVKKTSLYGNFNINDYIKEKQGFESTALQDEFEPLSSKDKSSEFFKKNKKYPRFSSLLSGSSPYTDCSGDISPLPSGLYKEQALTDLTVLKFLNFSKNLHSKGIAPLKFANLSNKNCDKKTERPKSDYDEYVFFQENKQNEIVSPNENELVLPNENEIDFQKGNAQKLGLQNSAIDLSSIAVLNQDIDFIGTEIQKSLSLAQQNRKTTFDY